MTKALEQVKDKQEANYVQVGELKPLPKSKTTTTNAKEVIFYDADKQEALEDRLWNLGYLSRTQCGQLAEIINQTLARQKEEIVEWVLKEVIGEDFTFPLEINKSIKVGKATIATIGYQNAKAEGANQLRETQRSKLMTLRVKDLEGDK